MEKEEKRGKYQGLSLPVSLINEVKKHIEEYREYKGVTEFVRQAIRAQLQYEKGKIWSENAIRDGRKIKRFITKKQKDQYEANDSEIDISIVDESTEVLNAFKELIRTVIREEKAKK